MDATATPRGISLAVGELGARGRPINKQCTAVRISSTVNGDMCGTCQANLLSLSALARDARNPRLLFRAVCTLRSSWRAPELLASSWWHWGLVASSSGLVDSLTTCCDGCRGRRALQS